MPLHRSKIVFFGLALVVIPIHVAIGFGVPEERPIEQSARWRAKNLGRGVVAIPVDSGVYVSWRLLKEDPQDVAFDVYRRVDKAPAVRINTQPIRQTTDFLDSTAPPNAFVEYSVLPSGDAPSPPIAADSLVRVARQPFLSLRLKHKDTTFQKVGITDLDGDGDFDFIIKQPNSNIDPWHKYWKKSPGTYKLEAYTSEGKFLWQKDLGWAIEQGIWYSPWIVYDLTGDGRAEVAAKIGEGDPRDDDGRVESGPEWMVVWDGMTGVEIARTPWPDRGLFPDYNRASRNQIAIAYLDGKTPSLIALRGTYKRMLADAYHLDGRQLKPLWKYDNKDLGRIYEGQGAHFTQAADVDGDGKDEIILGSAVLDDDGTPLWTTGKGHPDAAYLTDVDPHRAGLEMAYVMETRQETGGLCLADARTGQLLWQLNEPTKHVHGKGLCADIDPTVAGMEVFGADSESHEMTGARWLFAANGELLLSGDEIDFGFSVSTAYWDGDLQKELVGRRITNYEGISLLGKTEGRIVAIADIIGDWREELVVTVPGELRIYSTTLPAMDRRICLMQDPIYRMATTMNTMGYDQAPTTVDCAEAVAANINLTLLKTENGPACRVVVSAPLDHGVRGQVQIVAKGAIKLERTELQVDVAAGQRQVEMIEVELTGPRGAIQATLGTLRSTLPIRIE